MSEWITDRLPTQEEAGSFGWVRIPANNDRTWEAATWQRIKLGDPWAPWPKMPPFKSDEDRARESLPDGYRFVGRGNEDDHIFKSGERSVTFFKGKWELDPYPWNGSNSKAFYAVPEEPQPEPWSKPSDFPPVCWLWRPHWECCALVTSVYPKGVLRGRVVCSGMSPFKVSDLKDVRWSDRPFDRFEDGKPCVKGGGDE